MDHVPRPRRELADAAQERPRRTAAAPGSSRSASRRPGVVTFAYFSRRLARAVRGRLQERRAAVGGDVRDRLGDLPADRAAAVAHDRRAPGARAGARPPARHAAAHPGGVRARLPRHRARRCASRCRTTCSTARARCTGSSSAASSRTPRATSRAAGWPGHQRFALYGGLVLLESCSRFLFAVAAVVGLTTGRPPSRWAWRRRRSCPCRRAARVRRGRRDLEAVERPRRGLDAASRRRVRGARPRRRCSPSRPWSTRAVLTVDATRPTRRSPASCSTSCSSRARRCSSSRRSRAPSSPTSPPCRRRRGARSSAARSGSRCSRSRRSRARWRWGSSSSGRGRWACCSTSTTTTGAAASRSSRSAWAATSSAGTLNQAALARGQAAHAAPPGSLRAALFLGWMFTPIVDDELRARRGRLLRRRGAALRPARLVYRRPPRSLTDSQ